MITLNPGEKIILEARRHWFSISKTGAFLFVAAVAPILLFFMAILAFPEISETLGKAKFNELIAFLGASWLLLVWIMFFISWTDHYLDVLVVTDKRLIDVEQRGLFRRDVATVPINNIEDVKIEVNGVIATILKFGDLHVQTAGLSKELVIREIKSPAKVKEVIMSAYHSETKT